ncbi:PAS domain-containing protein [Marinobacter hydrocarbonoclasticus]|uniref:sensor histidine kinase n=1 Tax=Marinobacter nauticus TaxID=2743 RepID=UPI001A8F8514|nr:sensor histidine kinase [Marinobacter nauticus]MBN8238327.1 PAS domain-containing protein [Marinobacter nauticus]
MLRVDPKGRICELNNAGQQLDGRLQAGDSLAGWLDASGLEALERCLASRNSTEGAPLEFEACVEQRRYRLAVARLACLDGSRYIQITDITDYRALSENQRLLQACMAQVHDVIIITESTPLDAPGPRIIYVNEAVQRMTGYPPHEVLGRSPRLFQGPDTDPKALRRIRQALEARRPVKEIVVNYCKDGLPFWNEIEIVPIPASDAREKTYFASIQRDISQAKQREAELRYSQEELRRLSQAQEEVLEQERRRIARDLHDELGQTLTALKLRLALAVNALKELPSDQLKRLMTVIESVDGAVEKVREISSNLRPPMLDDLGFEATADWFLDRCAGRDGLEIDWQSESAGEGRVRGEVATALFRILQECMTNISRHSRASKVAIKYREGDDTVRMEIHDDGRGFDPGQTKNSGFGLVGIRERVAMLNGGLVVESAIGKGVRIRVELPLEGKGYD